MPETWVTLSRTHPSPPSSTSDKVCPVGPAADSLRTALNVGSVIQQHADAHPPPETHLGCKDAEDDSLDTGKVEKATAELGVGKRGDAAGIGRVLDGVAGHGG